MSEHITNEPDGEAYETRLARLEAFMRDAGPVLEAMANSAVPADFAPRLKAVEEALSAATPVLSDLAETGARAADHGLSIGGILAAVARQLLGHDIRKA